MTTIRTKASLRASIFGVTWFLTALFASLSASAVYAVSPEQTGAIQVQQNIAKVRYRVGIDFQISAKLAGGGEVEGAKLKLIYGKRLAEHIYDVPLKAGVGSYTVKDEDEQIVTGMTITYSWLLNTVQTVLQVPIKTVVYEDTSKRWYQKEGPKVTLRWFSGDDRYGTVMSQLAEDSLKTYKRRFNFDPTERIYITMYNSTSAYRSTFPEVPSWSGGFSRYGGVEIVAIAPDKFDGSVFIGEGIPHELSHAALYQFLHAPAPRWLNEGFAVYNQNTIAIEEYEEILRTAYKNNQLIPLSQLDALWPSDANSAYLAYAEGRSIVTFLINAYGNEVWSNLLDQLRRNDADGAMMAVFGINLEAMEQLWIDKTLAGKAVIMPQALKRGAVPSQPTEADIKAQQALTEARLNPDSGGGSLVTLLLFGFVAIVGIVAMGGGVFVISMNRRREMGLPVPAWLPGNKSAYDYDEVNDPYVTNHLARYSSDRPAEPKAAPAPSPIALAAVPPPIGVTPPTATSSDPFDFIVSSYGTSEPPAAKKTFLDNDPYGIINNKRNNGA